MAGVDIDLLCDFAIRRRDGVYRYAFGQERIAGWVTIIGDRNDNHEIAAALRARGL